MRITDSELKQTVKILNGWMNRAGIIQEPVFLELEYAYGRPKLILRDDNGNVYKELSPRLPRPEMNRFLNGMLTAVNMITDSRNGGLK